MKTPLVRIGNSRGIRIPKPLIEQVGLGETVDLRVEDHCLVISAEQRPRQGWEEAFLAAGSAARDEIMLDVRGAFDREEWKW
jgi:antitoxin MazE